MPFCFLTTSPLTPVPSLTPLPLPPETQSLSLSSLRALLRSAPSKALQPSCRVPIPKEEDAAPADISDVGELFGAASTAPPGVRPSPRAPSASAAGPHPGCGLGLMSLDDPGAIGEEGELGDGGRGAAAGDAQEEEEEEPGRKAAGPSPSDAHAHAHAPAGVSQGQEAGGVAPGASSSSEVDAADGEAAAEQAKKNAARAQIAALLCVSWLAAECLFPQNSERQKAHYTSPSYPSPPLLDPTSHLPAPTRRMRRPAPPPWRRTPATSSGPCPSSTVRRPPSSARATPPVPRPPTASSLPRWPPAT